MRSPSEKFRPMGSRVLVRMLTLGDEKIAIPERYAELPDRAVILAVGPGEKDKPMTLNVGDKVILDKHVNTTNKTRIGEKEFLIVFESEVAGILVPGIIE